MAVPSEWMEFAGVAFLQSVLSPPIFWSMKNLAKITLAVISTLLLVSIVLVFIIAHFTVVFILDTKINSRLFPSEMQVVSPALRQPSNLREWMLLTAKQRQILSQDNLVLKAYFIGATEPTNYTVILCHGYRNSALSMAEYAAAYHQAGWNVLVPDHRAHGYSQGRYITMGWKEHQDLILWANSLIDQNPQEQILLHGLSMGAATVMMAAGSPELPPNVVAAVEDCGYTSVTQELQDKVSHGLGLPSFPLVPVTSLLSRLQVGNFLGTVDCVDAVSRSKIPILFIHGENDSFVPFWMLEELYAAATCPKIKLVVPLAGHAQSQSLNPQLYWSTVEFFVTRFLPQDAPFQGRPSQGSFFPERSFDSK